MYGSLLALADRDEGQIQQYFEDHGIKECSWAAGVVHVLREKNAACRTRTTQVLADLEDLEARAVMQHLEEEISTLLPSSVQLREGVLKLHRARRTCKEVQQLMEEFNVARDGLLPWLSKAAVSEIQTLMLQTASAEEFVGVQIRRLSHTLQVYQWEQAEVLWELEASEEYGVNLASVEDAIDRLTQVRFKVAVIRQNVRRRCEELALGNIQLS
ncbi:hypothetical protein LXA43DRAFT_1067111 [Ganoderma leucocontextum]|nr:hypothetical protein LXA43DRAFT_1067111 [Ganoderma leucocontextum]